jgi:hypothetical protein
MINLYTEEMCAVGNTARALTRFGYLDDPRVGRLFRWILEDQRANGGWHCAPDLPGTLDAWEPLAALAAVPKPARTPAMDRAIERGAEFYLERELFREGARYGPWFRFHFPAHYFYDIFVGLDVLTSLGYGGDPRLGAALSVLRTKRRKDGSWAIDAVHPDAGRGQVHLHVKKAHPLQPERIGRPSKWLTLTALRILRRVEAAR